MAKRKLSLQQRRRIGAQQARSNASTPQSSTSPPVANRPVKSDARITTLVAAGELGPEQAGVVAVHHGRSAEVVPAQDLLARPIRCHLRANLNSLVTGDRVVWRAGETQGVITAVAPRTSELARPDADGRLRPVAANIDRIAIVVAPLPLAHANLIDRYLVAAENQGIRALLIANKTDLEVEELAALTALLAPYADLGYDLLWVSAHTGKGIAELAAYLARHTSVFVGQSGVGKSSLINALYPPAAARVGALSTGVQKGRQTTTAARLFSLPGGGGLIDSPGIREFGLWHLDGRQVFAGFIEFAPFLDQCRFRDCRHLDEPDCGLHQALASGLISPQRLASCREIVRSLGAN